MDEILTGQERIFESRRASLEGRITVTRQRIAQYDAQIGALDAQLASGRGQLALIREEMVGVQELADKGLERKPRLLALKRQAVDLEGEQGEYSNRIAQAREAIAEAELEIIRMEADDQREVATELREVQMRLAEVREKLAAAQVRQGRRDVVAPEAGTVLQHALLLARSRRFPRRPDPRSGAQGRPAGDRGAGASDRYRRRPCRAAGEGGLQRLQDADDAAVGRHGVAGFRRRHDGRAHGRSPITPPGSPSMPENSASWATASFSPACRRKP